MLEIFSVTQIVWSSYIRYMGRNFRTAFLSVWGGEGASTPMTDVCENHRELAGGTLLAGTLPLAHLSEVY